MFFEEHRREVGSRRNWGIYPRRRHLDTTALLSKRPAMIRAAKATIFDRTEGESSLSVAALILHRRKPLVGCSPDDVWSAKHFNRNRGSANPVDRRYRIPAAVQRRVQLGPFARPRNTNGAPHERSNTVISIEVLQQPQQKKERWGHPDPAFLLSRRWLFASTGWGLHDSGVGLAGEPDQAACFGGAYKATEVSVPKATLGELGVGPTHGVLEAGELDLFGFCHYSYEEFISVHCGGTAK